MSDLLKERIQPYRRDRGETWTPDETMLLLKIWSDRDIQAELSQNLYSNKHIYEAISSRMYKRNVVRSWKQCQGKLKGLKIKYRKAKACNNKGSHKMNPTFYKRLDDVMGKSTNVNTHETLEEYNHEKLGTVVIKEEDMTSFGEKEALSNDVESSQDPAENMSNKSDDDEYNYDDDDEIYATSFNSENTFHTQNPDSQIQQPCSSFLPNLTTHKPIPNCSTGVNLSRHVSPLPQNTDNNISWPGISSVNIPRRSAPPAGRDAFANAILAFTQMQKDSVDKFIALEEKRMQLEHEAELRRQQVEADSQLKLVNMVMSMMQNFIPRQNLSSASNPPPQPSTPDGFSFNQPNPGNDIKNAPNDRI